MTATQLSFIERALIGGAWVGADSGATLRRAQSGHRRDVSADVPDMGAAETRRAIEAAERALPGWRDRPPRNARRSCAAGSN